MGGHQRGSSGALRVGCVPRPAHAEAGVERAVAPDTGDDEVEPKERGGEPRPGHQATSREPEIQGEERKHAAAEDPDDPFDQPEPAACGCGGGSQVGFLSLGGFYLEPKTPTRIASASRTIGAQHATIHHIE